MNIDIFHMQVTYYFVDTVMSSNPSQTRGPFQTQVHSAGVNYGRDYP